ncbi:WLM domain-containing protein [Mrakia frigida]|uniref:metalloendopeptidase WSS1 n=1 Tax=Mrakia frigida TaxID=29902 RepID=UPI003FCC07EA
MSAPLVLKFSHLVKMSEPEKALGLLEKIASLVKPIMKKHSWTLPLLSEFFPSSSNLLGMNKNGGEQILIRLRPAHSPDRFLDLDDLIGTMLHELTHNVHGPHDEKFYAFMKVLNEEYDALISGGYSGEGFLSNGTRVGVGVAHDLPPHLAKAKALAAAEERAKKQRLMGPGGKIGGVRKVGKTPRELAADVSSIFSSEGAVWRGGRGRDVRRGGPRRVLPFDGQTSLTLAFSVLLV